MHSNYKSLLVFFLPLIISCSQALYVPSITESQKTGVPIDTLMMGRKLYVKNCGSCHRLYPPEQHTPRQWEKIVADMQKKANCTSKESTIILQYLNGKAGCE